MTNIQLHDDGLLPHLSHSRMQKYITCPEQYRLYYLEGFRPKYEAGARVFGAVMHLALAEYFRKQRDPLATFRTEWSACREFPLRYSQRESWEKLRSSRSGLRMSQPRSWERSIFLLLSKAKEDPGRVQNRGQRLGRARCAALRSAYRL